MRGPGIRLHNDVRRHWRCPACGSHRRQPAMVTTLMCYCEGGPFQMKLIEQQRHSRVPAPPLDLFMSEEECEDDGTPPPRAIDRTSVSQAPIANSEAAEAHPDSAPPRSDEGSSNEPLEANFESVNSENRTVDQRPLKNAQRSERPAGAGNSKHRPGHPQGQQRQNGPRGQRSDSHRNSNREQSHRDRRPEPGRVEPEITERDKTETIRAEGNSAQGNRNDSNSVGAHGGERNRDDRSHEERRTQDRNHSGKNQQRSQRRRQDSRTRPTRDDQNAQSVDNSQETPKQHDAPSTGDHSAE